MENEILFSEKQKFTQWWLWLFLIGINLFTLYGIYIQVLEGHPFGNNPASNTGLLLIFALTIGLTLLFASFRLDTQIRNDGIDYRFFPFHLSFRHVDWNDAEKIFVRKYNPLLEFGGWGIRYGIWGKGKAINMSGNKGLQIEFRNGKKLLIGTQKPADLEEVLCRLGKITSREMIA
jgi:hypothetical protein